MITTVRFRSTSICLDIESNQLVGSVSVITDSDLPKNITLRCDTIGTANAVKRLCEA